MTLSLRQKLEKARKVEGIRHEMETYVLAIAAKGKFSDYYRNRLIALRGELDAI